MTEEYDPRIQALLDQAQDDWGDPEINQSNLVPYGIEMLDKALYGVDIVNGELIMVLGEEKRRKTTFVVNVLINMFMGKKPKEKPLVLIDTLESSMRPRRYRDTLIANLASRSILRLGHRPGEYCPICRDAVCKELKLTPEFLRFRQRTQTQEMAIAQAMEEMYAWPLMLYGPGIGEGHTRNLTSARDRWTKHIQEDGAKIIVSDHVQQYSFGEGIVSDYEKQIRAVAEIGEVVGEHAVAFFLISQVSLTSIREAASGTGSIGAAGGRKGQQEANTVFLVGYEEGANRMKINIQESRKASAIRNIYHPLEPMSGAFYGAAYRE